MLRENAGFLPSYERLRKLPDDELVKLHREMLELYEEGRTR